MPQDRVLYSSAIPVPAHIGPWPGAEAFLAGRLISLQHLQNAGIEKFA
jgi:hypothetical protein